MMKHIVTLLLVPTLATVAIAQKKEVRYPSLPMDDKSKVVNYNEVVEVGGATAKDLYARFMEWGKGYHNGFAGKLRKNDEANGAVEVFANMRYYAHDAKGAKTTSLIGVIQYTMFLDFKEGKYRYRITDINVKASSYQPIEKWLDTTDPDATNKALYLADMDGEITSMIAEMKKAMKTPAAKKSDDW
jgi:hypothetical protein